MGCGTDMVENPVNYGGGKAVNEEKEKYLGSMQVERNINGGASGIWTFASAVHRGGRVVGRGAWSTGNLEAQTNNSRTQVTLAVVEYKIS